MEGRFLSRIRPFRTKNHVDSATTKVATLFEYIAAMIPDHKGREMRETKDFGKT